jgi:hypothetical protein
MPTINSRNDIRHLLKCWQFFRLSGMPHYDWNCLTFHFHGIFRDILEDICRCLTSWHWLMVYELSSLSNTHHLYYFKEIIVMVSFIYIVIGSQLRSIDSQVYISKVQYIIIWFGRFAINVSVCYQIPRIGLKVLLNCTPVNKWRPTRLETAEHTHTHTHTQTHMYMYLKNHNTVLSGRSN